MISKVFLLGFNKIICLLASDVIHCSIIHIYPYDMQYMTLAASQVYFFQNAAAVC